MNASKTMLAFSLIFFILCFFISSVYSSEDPSEIRYLEDETTDEPVKNNTNRDKINCKENNTYKCAIQNMKCDDTVNLTNCTCKDDSFYPNFDDGVKANYCELKQKKQLVAFLLELFVGFGAGHFYRKGYLMASLKLVAFFIGIYLICLFPLAAKCISDGCDSDCGVIVISIIFYLYALGLAFWYIWDLVYFGKNKYDDLSNEGTPIKLKPWK